MTTFTPHDSRLDERVREAWSLYRDSLASLDGRAYDDAEAGSWDELQESLRRIEADRSITPAPDDTT